MTIFYSEYSSVEMDEKLVNSSNQKSTSAKHQDATNQIEMLEKFLNFFMKINESPASTLRTLDNEKVKRYFQIAFAIENAIDHIASINPPEMGSSALQTIFENNKISANYTTTFLRKACDCLLLKFFKINESFLFKTEVAVRIYTSLLPPKRFEEFLCELFIESSSYKAIEEFIFKNKEIDIQSLHFKLILFDWISEHKKDEYVGLSSSIQEMLTPYKVQQSLFVLIGIISLDTNSEDENNLRSLVLKEVLQKMFCRNILSKKFWSTLFEIDKTLLLKACIKSEDFHVSICNFLIFIGSMMDMKKEKSHPSWCPNSTTSVYPEFNYDWLIKIIQYLSCKSFSKRDVTMKKLLDAEEETDCPLWRHLLMIL